LSYYKNFDFKEADRLIMQALKEDMGSGDVTSDSLIPAGSASKAVIRVKDTGIIAGLEIFKRVFKILDKKVTVELYIAEGRRVKKGTVAGEVRGSTRSLLKGERTALNILQRMSGIATHTDNLKKKLGNKSIKIIDTRKTTPNFRLFEKLAVRIGGGANHRFGLYDMMLIKDNHIEANGGIENTIELLKKMNKKKNIKVEIEVKDLSELQTVLDAPKGVINRVMLDNFSIDNVRKAIRLNRGKYELEVSGGVNIRNIFRYKGLKGLDFISTGSVTHSVNSLDISLDFVS
jgi:nicotinate-nucleotide pyrophosphorylase (carboxylating)